MTSLPDLNQKIQSAAKRLLAEGKAEVVIGCRQGTTPMTVAPIFCRTEDDCNQLIWSNFAKINLATYLPKYPGKVAIIAKGCDARSAVGQVVEKQIERENLYIVGVACGGLVDVEQIQAREPRPIRAAEEDWATIKLSGDGWSSSLPKEDVLRRNCKTCVSRTPEGVADELIGEPTEALPADDYADLKALAGQSLEEKMAYFKGLVKNCLRCYACRNACPLCYCPVCFVDETRPQWLGKSQDEMDTFTFHLLRAFHCSGRCTSCGGCEAACPMDIKLREFNRLLDEEVQKDWNYLPGLSWDQTPPLTTYRPDDEADFIK
ncbi:MAG: 4Fe-4S ferredoxin [Candidatus Adiutrix sp.]|jgi:ferredoxin|nr:4Fe-4S ferredoxin [Candidatus Adiutrix sp.]